MSVNQAKPWENQQMRNGLTTTELQVWRTNIDDINDGSTVKNMAYMETVKKSRTKVRNLIKMGVPEDLTYSSG